MKKALVVILAIGLIGLASIVTLLLFLVIQLSQSIPTLPEYRLAWQPEDQGFAVCGNGSLTLFSNDLELVNRRDDIRKPAGGELTIAISWSGSNDTLLYVSDFVDVGIWDLRPDTVTQLPDANFPVAWNMAGDLIATGGPNHVIQIRDGTSYDIITSLPGFTYSSGQYTDLVYALAWSATGDFLAGRYGSGTVRVWNTETNELVHTLERDARSLSWGTGPELAISTNDNTLEIWNVVTRELVQSFPVEGSLVRWNPTQSYIAIVSNKTIELWNADDASRIHQLEDHARRISDVQWNADGTVLVSIDISGKIILWEVESGNILNSTQME